MRKVERALTFRVALDQKLYAIVQAFGSSAEGARQCKVAGRSFNRWRSGESYPTTGMLTRVDEVYAMAVELLNDPELMRQRRKTTRKIRRIAGKLRLSHEAVKQLQAEGLY